MLVKHGVFICLLACAVLHKISCIGSLWFSWVLHYVNGIFMFSDIGHIATFTRELVRFSSGDDTEFKINNG